MKVNFMTSKYKYTCGPHCFCHVAMTRARETTENRRSVVVQKTRICNYGQARYKLASALSGASGYSLTDEFKHAVRLLPSTYTVRNYMGFLDDWGTVSQLSVLIFLVASQCTEEESLVTSINFVA